MVKFTALAMCVYCALSPIFSFCIGVWVGGSILSNLFEVYGNLSISTKLLSCIAGVNIVTTKHHACSHSRLWSAVEWHPIIGSM